MKSVFLRTIIGLNVNINLLKTLPIDAECRKADERGSSGHHRALGQFGDYSCDGSLALIESAARYMRTRHPENVEFVLWTGYVGFIVVLYLHL